MYLFTYSYFYLFIYVFICLFIWQFLFRHPVWMIFHVTGALKLRFIAKPRIVVATRIFFVLNLPPTSGDVITSERCEEAIRGLIQSTKSVIKGVSRDPCLMGPLYGKRDPYKRDPYL